MVAVVGTIAAHFSLPKSLRSGGIGFDVDIDLSWLSSSSLTNKTMDIPEIPSEGIPSTYVPARNTMMMTLALAWAETINCSDIFIGVNAIDYSGYIRNLRA